MSSFLAPLVCSLGLCAQDAAPKAPAQWTQAELERVSDEIRADLEKMRGLTFKRPVTVKLADKQGFIDYARKRMQQTQTPARAHRDETIAKMLGLIEPDMDLMKAFEDFLQEQVGGFYDPATDTFCLMDTFTGDIARIILAHELTHALDDQCYDLDGTLAKLNEETDAEFAFGAVTEGSGTAAMFQWMFSRMGEIDASALQNAGDLGTAGLDRAPQYIWKPLIAVYLRGQMFLGRTGKGNMTLSKVANEDVRRAFENPPRSSEQILHPEKYWSDDKRDEPRRLEFDKSKLPEGFTVVGEDTLGEIMLALLATPIADRKPLDPKNPMAMLTIAYTNTAAQGWGGDRALLLASGDERRLELATVWDTPKDAQEFHAACKAVLDGESTNTKQPSGASVELTGEDAVVIRAFWGANAAGLDAIPWREKK